MGTCICQRGRSNAFLIKAERKCGAVALLVYKASSCSTNSVHLILIVFLYTCSWLAYATKKHSIVSHSPSPKLQLSCAAKRGEGQCLLCFWRLEVREPSLKKRAEPIDKTVIFLRKQKTGLKLSQLCTLVLGLDRYPSRAALLIAAYWYVKHCYSISFCIRKNPL